MVFDPMANPLKNANTLLTRALDLETKCRYIEALVCYQEGLDIAMGYLKVAPESQKKKVRDQCMHFMEKAEAVKKRVEEEMKLSTYHEERVIADNETGHSYESVFGHLLKDDVEIVKVEDPYIRHHHQFPNFVRLCELLVKKCPRLKKIILVTIYTDSLQSDFISQIRTSLHNRGINFNSIDNPTLHDRQISLSNGWVIKLGRGLDYFKPPAGKFSIGSQDMDLRPCLQTNIDMYYTKDLIID